MALCLGCGLQVDADGYPAVQPAPPLICDDNGVGVKLGDRMYVDGGTGALSYHDPVRVKAITSVDVINLGDAAYAPDPVTKIRDITGWRYMSTLSNPFPGTAFLSITFTGNMTGQILKGTPDSIQAGAHVGQLEVFPSLDGGFTTIAVAAFFNAARYSNLGSFGFYEGYSSGSWPLVFGLPAGWNGTLAYFLRWYSPTDDIGICSAQQIAATQLWTWEQPL